MPATVEIVRAGCSYTHSAYADSPMKDWNALSDENFRQQIRSFFEAHFPKHLTHLSRYPRWADVKEWYLKLSAQGWAAPNWPRSSNAAGRGASFPAASRPPPRRLPSSFGPHQTLPTCRS